MLFLKKLCFLFCATSCILPCYAIRNDSLYADSNPMKLRSLFLLHGRQCFSKNTLCNPCEIDLHFDFKFMKIDAHTVRCQQKDSNFDGTCVTCMLPGKEHGRIFHIDFNSKLCQEKLKETFLQINRNLFQELNNFTQDKCAERKTSSTYNRILEIGLMSNFNKYPTIFSEQGSPCDTKFDCNKGLLCINDLCRKKGLSRTLLVGILSGVIFVVLAISMISCRLISNNNKKPDNQEVIHPESIQEAKIRLSTMSSPEEEKPESGNKITDDAIHTSKYSFP